MYFSYKLHILTVGLPTIFDSQVIPKWCIGSSLVAQPAGNDIQDAPYRTRDLTATAHLTTLFASPVPKRRNENTTRSLHETVNCKTLKSPN